MNQPSLDQSECPIEINEIAQPLRLQVQVYQTTNSESSLAHLYLNLMTNDWVYCLDLVIPSQSYFSLPIGCHDCAQPPFLLVFIEPLVSQLARTIPVIQKFPPFQQSSSPQQVLFPKTTLLQTTSFLLHLYSLPLPLLLLLLTLWNHPSLHLILSACFLPRNLPSTVPTTVFVYRIIY